MSTVFIRSPFPECDCDETVGTNTNDMCRFPAEECRDCKCMDRGQLR